MYYADYVLKDGPWQVRLAIAAVLVCAGLTIHALHRAHVRTPRSKKKRAFEHEIMQAVSTTLWGVGIVVAVFVACTFLPPAL